MVFDAEQLPGTLGSISEYLVMKSSDLWRNVHFVRVRTQSNFIGLKFWTKVKPCQLPTSGRSECFKNSHERTLVSGKNNSWRSDNIGPPGFLTFQKGPFLPLSSSTLSPCSPNTHQMLAPVCKVCAYLVVLLIYLYLPVEKYPTTWGPGESAHLKELYQRGAHVLRSDVLKSYFPPLLTSVRGSERITMSELKMVRDGDIGRQYRKQTYLTHWGACNTPRKPKFLGDMGMGRGGSGEWVIGDSTEYQSGIHFIYETIER